MSGERERLVDAMHADGHSLRVGPDGYVMDHLMPVVDRMLREAQADALESAANVPLKACCPEHATKHIRYRAAALRDQPG